MAAASVCGNIAPQAAWPVQLGSSGGYDWCVMYLRLPSWDALQKLHLWLIMCPSSGCNCIPGWMNVWVPDIKPGLGICTSE